MERLKKTNDSVRVNLFEESGKKFFSISLNNGGMSWCHYKDLPIPQEVSEKGIDACWKWGEEKETAIAAVSQTRTISAPSEKEWADTIRGTLYEHDLKRM